MLCSFAPRNYWKHLGIIQSRRSVSRLWWRMQLGIILFFFSSKFDNPIIQPLKAWLKRYSTPKKMQKAKNSNIKRETPVHVNSFNTTLEEKSFWPDQGWPTWAKIKISHSKSRNRGCDYHTLNSPKKQDKRFWARPRIRTNKEKDFEPA